MQHLIHTPLTTYCQELTDLLEQATKKADPALFLYTQKARTPLFMAESLVRVLDGMAPTKKTAKATKRFKKPEDMLGAIENYEDLAKYFITWPDVTKQEVEYFTKKHNNAIKKLNAKLLKKGYYISVFKEISWQLNIDFNSKPVAERLRAQIRRELDECFDFYSEFRDGFTDMEEQVHELRRKLRWISIYSQSFKGMIALEKDKTKYAWEKTFIPKKSEALAFNTLTINKHLTAYVNFNQKAFFALNFVVEELGKIKDKGLRVEALKKAIKKGSGITGAEAEALALKKIQANHAIPDLLREAHGLLREFFDTHGIHKLLV